MNRKKQFYLEKHKNIFNIFKGFFAMNKTIFEKYKNGELTGMEVVKILNYEIGTNKFNFSRDILDMFLKEIKFIDSVEVINNVVDRKNKEAIKKEKKVKVLKKKAKEMVEILPISPPVETIESIKEKKMLEVELMAIEGEIAVNENKIISRDILKEARDEVRKMETGTQKQRFLVDLINAINKPNSNIIIKE